MADRISMGARREVLAALGDRYLSARRQEKRVCSHRVIRETVRNAHEATLEVLAGRTPPLDIFRWQTVICHRGRSICHPMGADWAASP